MASSKVPCDDSIGITSDPAQEPADSKAGEAPETVRRTDKERELSERVRRKIKSIRSKTKRYVN